jgi:alpha-tubulin suppressor-like RCC1 family protein
MSHFSISYAHEAILTEITNITITDGQIVNSTYGVEYYGTAAPKVFLYNVLFANVPIALFNNGWNNSVVTWGVVNSTFGGDAAGGATLLSSGYSNVLFLTNCILANLSQFTNGPGTTLDAAYNGFYSNIPAAFGNNSLSTNVLPFQTNGAGSFYLTNGCPFLGAGTTAIDSGALADIQVKTVFPPNTDLWGLEIVAPVTFSPQVARDSGPALALGYHYDALDYALYMAIQDTTLTILPGTAIAMAGPGYGINLVSGATLDCEGTATDLAVLTRYTTVQEQSNPNWESAWWGFFSPNSASISNVVLRFTEVTELASEYYFYGVSAATFPFNLQNCQIYNGSFWNYGATLTATNNLFRRSFVYLDESVAQTNQFRNNLFWRGNVYLLHNSWGTNVWTFTDNLFDQAAITQSANMDFTANNAYVNLSGFTNVFPTTNQVPLTNSPGYTNGSLGYYYYPTGQTNLIFNGSQLASAAGLNLYTVTTNDVVDGTNIVSIGFHYATPPYISQQPMSQIVSYSNAATFRVAAGGSAPLSYQWQLNGINIAGATNSTYSISAVVAGDPGRYTVVVGDAYSQVTSAPATLTIQPAFVVAWGDRLDLTIPLNPSPNDAVALAAGSFFCLALSSNGTVIGWGDDTFKNVSGIPTGLTNVVSIAAGQYHSLALLNNGTVTNWGYYNDGFSQNPVSNYPISTNAIGVIAIAAGEAQDIALKADGTVAVWGQNNNSDGPFYHAVTNPIPNSGIKAVACGESNNIALLTGGNLICWGNTNQPPLPSNLAMPGVGVVAIAAYLNRYMALLSTGRVQAWGATNAPVPAGLTNAVAIAVGVGASLAITSNGTLVAWGIDMGMTNLPTGLSNVTFVAADNRNVFVLAGGSLQVPQVVSMSPSASGLLWVTTNTTLSFLATNSFPSNYTIGYQWFFNGVLNTNFNNSTNFSIATTNSVPLFTDEGSYEVVLTNLGGASSLTWNLRVALPGMAAAWGSDTYGECDRPPLTNFLAVAAGEYHSLGLRADGTVTNWGKFWDGTYFLPLVGPGNNSGFVAVAAGAQHDIGLTTNGTVVAWGNGTNAVANWAPAGLTNVSAIAAGWDHNLALSNGAVVAWGANLPYATNLTNVPPDLTTAGAATAISAEALHSLVLRSNGTVEAWGYGSYGEASAPTSLAHIVAVAAGGQHNLVLSNNGTVFAWGNNTSGQCNVPSALTNGSSTAIAIAAGWAHSVVLLNDGTVVSWGDNLFGEATVPAQLNYAIGRSIAAGGYHTVEGIFSSALQYPVNISRDLLLIYNTNSADSSNMCMYYLNNRPMVSNAMVFGIGCTTADTISLAAFSTSIQAPIQGWLSTNPLIRPDYVILFQDIPYEILDTNGDWPSVQYELHYLTAPGWRPHVTSINMNGPLTTNIGNFSNGTVDSSNYIYKIISMGSNDPPGTLIISGSGSATGYSNTTWYFDSGYGVTYTNYSTDAEQGVIAANPAATIVGPTNFNASATNVAGYFTPGGDGGGNTYMFTNGTVKFYGQSGWYIMATIDSYNGDRQMGSADYLSWFATNSFGGTNYANTPIGAVTTVNEPWVGGKPNPYIYYGDWAAGKSFGISAWDAQEVGNGGAFTQYFQAVGDPFVRR